MHSNPQQQRTLRQTTHSSALAVALSHFSGMIRHRDHLPFHQFQGDRRLRKEEASSLRCSFLLLRAARTSSVCVPVSDYRKAQRRLAQQRMLMRHMHMGIIMFIIMTRLLFIAHSPFLGCWQKDITGYTHCQPFQAAPLVFLRFFTFFSTGSNIRGGVVKSCDPSCNLT